MSCNRVTFFLRESVWTALSFAGRRLTLQVLLKASPAMPCRVNVAFRGDGQEASQSWWIWILEWGFCANRLTLRILIAFGRWRKELAITHVISLSRTDEIFASGTWLTNRLRPACWAWTWVRDFDGQSTKGTWGMPWRWVNEGRGSLRKSWGSWQTNDDPGVPDCCPLNT